MILKNKWKFLVHLVHLNREPIKKKINHQIRNRKKYFNKKYLIIRDLWRGDQNQNLYEKSEKVGDRGDILGMFVIIRKVIRFRIT